MGFKITGKLPSGKHLEQIRQSPNYKENGFSNLSVTPMMAEDASYWKMLNNFFKRNKNAAPPVPVPSVKTDLRNLSQEEPVIIWFGHSSYFIRIEGKNFLIDPVFSGNAAPFSFMVKAFPGTGVYNADTMPGIDYLILTHDHYDHLDYKTIIKLKHKVGKIYCSLGLGSHLKYWGIHKEIIAELDWWDSHIIEENISLTATPSRHFSGRGIKRAQTLWSSFVLKTAKHNLFLGGDSGYDHHFKEIGKKHGPFDIAILESGQYNVMWPLIHMMPEQTVQAAIDLKAEVLLPVHWGKFTLSMHPWNEPVTRVLHSAKESGIKVTTPMIGEPVILGRSYPTKEWWKL